MTLSELGLDALRVSLILGASMVIARALPRRAASLRRLVRATAFGCALLLPFAARLAPAVALPSSSLPSIVARPFAEPASEAPATGPATRAVIQERDGAPRESRAPIALGDVALLAWALVAGALLVRLGRAHAKAYGITKRADFELDPAWRALVGEMVGPRASALAVGISDEIDSPAAFGIFSSTVLLPRASASWGEARRRAALAHELAHVGAKDGLGRLVAHVVCALHWFDPLAWLAARGLRFDQEVAADEAALAGGIAPSRYASDLLEIACSAPRAPVATVAMASRSELERRIRAIVAVAPAFRASRPLSVFAFASVAASAMLLACARPPAGDAPGGAAAVAAPPAAVASPKTAPGGAELQAIVDDEIARLVAETSASRAVVIALDPSSGRVLAEAGRERGAPADVAFGEALVPGSTFKVVAISAALDAGLIAATSRFDCRPRGSGAQTLHDSSANEDLTLGEVVARSSNVGVSRIVDALGEQRFAEAVRRFHFGEAPAGFAHATAGVVPRSMTASAFDAELAAIGEGTLQASPAQIAAAYATIAAGGVYHAPSRSGSAGERVISEPAARAMLDLLDGAVNGPQATGAAARIDGLRVAGKTGTADFAGDGEAHHIYASFVGIAPREAPRVVLLVGADLAGEAAKDASGGKIAAPVFARIVGRAYAQ